MKRIHVVMVLHSYYPIVGGAEKQLQALIPLFRARGIQITILTRLYTNLSAFEIVDNIPVYRVPAPGPKALAAIIFILAAVWRVWRLKPDIVHAYDLQSPTSIALISRWLFHVPVVAKVLSGGPRGDIDRIRSRFGGEWRLRVIGQQVDKFVVISREIVAELDTIGAMGEQYAHIPNGVDLDRFHPIIPSEKDEIRKTLNLPLNDPVVLFVGRLIVEKRPEHLIQIWPAIRKKHPGAIMVMVGAGEMEAQLKAMTVDGVRLVGESNQVISYLQAADLFVLPSAREGLSNALLEAQASGVPVVATNIGAAPELIEDGKSGILISPDDIDTLRVSILKLLDDKALRQKFSKIGLERVARGFSLGNTADRLTELYQKLSTRETA